MKILSKEEILEIERRTLEVQGITTLNLIERAATAVASEVKALSLPTAPLFIIAGWGNNGADALETARLLALEGYKPSVYLFNVGGDRLNNECKTIKERLLDTPEVNLFEITGSSPFQWPEIPANALVVDGLFGSGLNQPLPRTFQLLAQNIQQSGCVVVSIDVPSGLAGEWNGDASRSEMFNATVTVTFEFPRLAFMFAENARAVGTWKVARIGYDSSAIREAPYTYVLIDRGIVAKRLLPRNKFASKADFGSAMIFAGSRGMAGAAVLAARGALRAGAGKVTVYSSSDNCNILQTAVPSAMFIGDKHSHAIATMPFDSRYNSFAVGPGLGTSEDTAFAFEKFVKAAAAAGRRIIVDADALNIIAQRPSILGYLTPLSIITPHAAEFDRIFGPSSSEEQRLSKAIKSAEEYNLIIVLKGCYTAIVRPDGKVMFNSTGTPAMATPGSGDVLTGIMAGLMATGMISEIAAFVATYIHGLAGELAAAKHGEYGVTAEDIAG